MKIHILQATRPISGRSNKDTNGGYGTINDFGTGLTSRALTFVKARNMNFPELAPAYVSAILQSQGHEITYGENTANPEADITLLQSSLVHYYEEIRWARELKSQYPSMRVGFFGGVCDTLFDELLTVADFVISGEVESALMRGDIGTFEGREFGGLVSDLDSIPFPNWDHVITSVPYNLVTKARATRMAPMLASRGCPMSCRFYCTYPLTQGAKLRRRSIDKVINEVVYLNDHYGINLILFRDPIFTLDMERTKAFCRAIQALDRDINYIIETHTKYIDDEMVSLLAASGCVAIQFGIESGNRGVMEKSNRAVNPFEDQKFAIDTCERAGIKVLALFMLGFFDDTMDTAKQTIDYAIELNPYGAQFTVATPYPGTPWYAQLKQDNAQYELSENYDEYTQYQLVYNHPHLTQRNITELKNRAYNRYYCRYTYIKKHHLPWSGSA